MSLLDENMLPCVKMIWGQRPDGEGGLVNDYVEGGMLEAAIVLDTSTEARSAQQQGLTSVYTVITRRKDAPDYRTILKRLSDGAFFRITSDGKEKKTPMSAGLDMAVATAEKLERLPE